MAHPDEMYVDIGAANAEEVRAAGVDLLDPISLAREALKLGTDELASPAIGDRIGCVVLTELLQTLKGHPGKLPGTLTVAFAAQQWTGGRGLDRLLNELHPDEMVYVGRFLPPRGEDAKSATPPNNPMKLGAGVLVGTPDASAALSGLAAEIKKIGDAQHVAVTAVTAAAPAMASYAKPTPLPARFAHVGVASLYPVTPAESLSSKGCLSAWSGALSVCGGRSSHGWYRFRRNVELRRLWASTHRAANRSLRCERPRRKSSRTGEETSPGVG